MAARSQLPGMRSIRRSHKASLRIGVFTGVVPVLGACRMASRCQPRLATGTLRRNPESRRRTIRPRGDADSSLALPSRTSENVRRWSDGMDATDCYLNGDGVTLFAPRQSHGSGSHLYARWNLVRFLGSVPLDVFVLSGRTPSARRASRRSNSYSVQTSDPLIPIQSHKKGAGFALMLNGHPELLKRRHLAKSRQPARKGQRYK
jgi:hypothetical protein